MATYDDMTVVQYERYRTGGFTRYPRRTLDAWRRRQRAVYQRANVCTVMSEWAKASIVDDYGLAPEKVFVVGAGINVTFAAVPNREWQRPRFLIVARDWRRKNVPQVVEALEFVRETWADATLDIVGPYPGPTPDGVVAHGLLNPADHDDRARIAALYETATCFVMPSQFEPFGIAYAEAGAAGVPSIGTAIGGASELIGDGGFVVDPNSHSDLCAAMVAMCDPATARKLGKIAEARSVEFRWESVARRIVDALGANVPLG